MSNPSRFVWHDLSTRDVESAKRFYGELFGWKFEQGAGDPYVHVAAGDRMIGGIRAKEEGEPGPPSWLGYVLVDDVDAAVERATAAGGATCVPATTLPDVGTFAVLADPSGGVLAAWRSARDGENTDDDPPPADHTFCWDELLTTDPAAATAFYTRVFGWTSEVQNLGAMGDYTLFGRPGTKNPTQAGKPAWAAGVMPSPPGVPHSFWLAYVQVDDVDAAAERAASLGGTVTVPPTDIPTVGRYGVFTDPEGATLGVLQFAQG